MNYAVVLAGGSGSRFWPLSRKNIPKQFLKIIGEESLLEATIRRIKQVITPENIFVVSSLLYLKELNKQVKQFGIPKENIILEPSPKNTLPAIALCAQIIGRKDSSANLLVFPSDHYIGDNPGFIRTMRRALSLSAKRHICLIGIKPDKPRLGYGYIQAGRAMGKNAFLVKYFHEKPDINRAKHLFRKDNVYWNAGIFVFQTAVVLGEIKKYFPQLYRQIRNIKNKQAWQKIKPISIDYAILEKSEKLVMVPAEFKWCDLGSWDALSSVLEKDKDGNIFLANCDSMNLDTENTLIYSYNRKKVIAAVGLRGLIIVDTPDALLVCRKEKAQDIKRLVEILKSKRSKCV